MKYKVWSDAQEQWDANNIPPPVAEVEADNTFLAAVRFADRHHEDTNPCDLIIQKPDGTWRKCKVERSWTVNSFSTTTLEELCAP